MAHVTLGEAARQTGRSKSQISRAIRAGQLSAERSAETASFRIEQSELQRWLDATNIIRATVLAGVEENPATGAQHAALEAQVERFKEAADLLRSQLADALSERNEWREAFKQQRALPPPQPAGEPPQGWWRWLALTTLLAIVVTAAIVAATALAISFALAERPASFSDEPAVDRPIGFREAGAPDRSAAFRAHGRRGVATSNSGVLRRPFESAQYVSIKYTERLAEAGVEPSVGSVGDSYDNALAETINGLYKAEVIHRRGPWRNFEAVEFATLEWVDWFNNRRLLEPIGNIPPAEAEQRYYAMLEQAAMAA